MGWVFKLFQIDFGGDATSKYYRYQSLHWVLEAQIVVFL
jgi:hypothetical protein